MPAAPTEVAVHRPERHAGRMGFFTDTTTCIGCKACEVACKQWNDLPADELRLGKGHSYDYTGGLSASTWRHVRFVEVVKPTREAQDAARAQLASNGGGRLPNIPAARPAGAEDLPDLVDLAAGGGGTPPLGAPAGEGGTELDRWLFMSDVCHHCTNAGCLDACPTGALIRTEFETVIVQPDICNGCGYCVPSCPFGVIDRDPYDGRAAKCTLCYDRLEDGLEPACAKACPTDSIQFGPYDELVERAKGRVLALHERGLDGAYLYGAGDEPGEQLAGNLGAFVLLTEPPERFGLPANADSPIQENMPTATAAGLVAAVAAAAATVATTVLAHRRRR
jgi:formate dehydrogenase iron-sulfur subunit